MTGRGQFKRRRRRADRGIVLRLLSALIICGCLVAALTMFFRVKAVNISGNARYSARQVQTAAGVSDGDNLFFMNKYAMADRIVRELPYVVDAHISRELPDTLIIAVRECGTPLAVAQEDGVWLISPVGKIVDHVEDGSGYIPITGCTLEDPAVGEAVSLGAKTESLTGLLTALEDAGMLDQVGQVNVEDRTCIRVEYAGRFTVLFPYHADYAYKLHALSETLAEGKIQENMTGTFDATKDGKIFFRQNAR